MLGTHWPGYKKAPRMVLKHVRRQHGEFKDQLEQGCDELRDVAETHFPELMQHFQRNSKLAESSKRLKSQIWSSVVTILLVKAKDLPLAEDGSKLNDTHFKFRFVALVLRFPGFKTPIISQIGQRKVQEQDLLDGALAGAVRLAPLR